MTDSSRRDLLKSKLIDATASLPTSSLGRLGRSAVVGLRSARAWRKGARDGRDVELDAAQLARIVTSLGELKGVAMKMAQIMSYVDMALPDELKDALAVLQTHAQPMPTERVRALIREAIGPQAEVLLATLSETPIAAASIGQVHRATLDDGTPVAVKVQYPEVARAIRADFASASIGPKVASMLYPGSKVDAFVAEAKERFLAECDYAQEAASQARFVALIADDPLIVIPEVHPAFSAARVLTTTFIEGVSLDTYLAGDPPQATRDAVGEALFRFYVGSIFAHGLYNCDPHPGNFLFTPDGRLAVLDYGCTRAFEPAFVERLAELTRAVHADDRDQLHQAFLGLGMVRPDKRYDFDTTRRLVRAFYGPMLRDEVLAIEEGEALTMREVIEGKQALIKLALPGEFLFLLRIRFGLMSILARLGARQNWYQLERAMVGAVRATGRSA